MRKQGGKSGSGGAGARGARRRAGSSAKRRDRSTAGAKVHRAVGGGSAGSKGGAGPARLRRKVSRIADKLEEIYGRPHPPEQSPVLDQLVSAILSQNTNDRNSGRAWRRLKDRFPSWREAAAAPASETEEAIRVGGLAPSKSRRIKALLEEVARAGRGRDGSQDTCAGGGVAGLENRAGGDLTESPREGAGGTGQAAKGGGSRTEAAGAGAGRETAPAGGKSSGSVAGASHQPGRTCAAGKAQAAHGADVPSTGAAAGDFDLEFVREMGNEEAMEFLTSMRGAGVKTAAVVLLFGMGRDVFPVDTHVHRLCRRLGLVEQGASRDETFRQMRGLVPEGRSLSLHLNLIRFGRERCRKRNPLCDGCPLRRECYYSKSSKSTR